MILVVDNYDSFVYTLARYLEEEGRAVRVVRNDAVEPREAAALEPEAVVLSPGPKDPDRSGPLLDLVRTFAGRVPMLGVCLGHQAIVRAFGGVVKRAARVVHGSASPVEHDGGELFAGVPSPFPAGRYHSLVAEPAPGGPLRVTAWSEGVAMAVEHVELPVWGVQFHPESVLTPDGRRIMGNFLRLADRGREGRDAGVV